MTPEQREAAERLINEYIAYDEVLDWPAEAAALLRELLAEPVQEPVGWLNEIDGEFEHSHKPWMDNPTEEWHPVYAAPQQRKPLTDEAIEAILNEFDVDREAWKPLARAIERAITGEPT